MGRAIRVVLGALLLLGSAAPLPASAEPTSPLKAEEPEILAEAAVPQACFTFSGRLERGGPVPMDSFVRVEPAATVAASVRDNRLCIEGLSHARSYKVTLRQGLPGVGKKLERAQTFDVRVPDREPQVAFASRGHVLPRVGSEGLPLRTINVSRVQIEIARINDRSLIESIRGDKIGDALSAYDLKALQTTRGEAVWQGTLEVDGERNKPTITALPLGATIGTLAHGVYVAVASLPGTDEEKSWQEMATQWFVVSDLGLTTFMGADGLTAHVRSLETTTPVGGVELMLIARNNKDLGRIVTNRDGFARFDAGLLRGKGGNAPAALYAATAHGDFVFLNLEAPGLDLTDRGVKGRVAAGPLEAFLYTERGIYRPGETVQLTGLLRDERANAAPNLPVTVKLLRPDGHEADRRTLSDQGGGSYSLSLGLAPTAYTGQWTAQAFTDVKADPVGAVSFQVEDFVPPRIEFDLMAENDRFSVGEPQTIRAAARYLYGAPAADLKGELAVVVRAADNPFPRHPGFQFGLAEEETPSPIQLDPVEFSTDEDGNAEAEVMIDALPDTSRPLEAEVRATIFDVGGRPVQREIIVPVTNGEVSIGILPRFSDGLPQNALAAFDVIALGRDGTLLDRQALGWELLDEDYDFSWYRTDGRWEYRRTVRERRIASGAIDASATGAIRLEAQVASGQYRLEVFDRESGAATSVRFTAGYWSATNAEDEEKPDQVSVIPAPRSDPATGTAAVMIKPPFEAEVLITVVDRRVRTAFSRRISPEGLSVEIPVEADWTGGVYVLATAFAPADRTQSHLPRRAVGLAWVPADLQSRALKVAIESPEKIRPQESISVPVTVAGAEPNESAFITLAAVDDAVLQLTDYKAPDPEDFFLGQRGLEVTIRDIYGKLIDPMGAQAGRVRSGGDGDLSRQLTNLPQKTSRVLALYSGIVRLGSDGRAEIQLDIPDFNGRVRLMAVAWTASKLGNAEATMLVRAPVIAELALPRFLAPGDTAELALSLHNVEGPPGDYRVEISTDGPFVVREGSTVTTALAAEQRGKQLVTIHSPTAGDGTIRLALSGPGDFRLAREWPISSRPGNPTVTRRTVGVLNPGQQLAFEAGPLTAGLVRETASVSLAVSSGPELNVAAIIQQLDRFPYGCAEQVTSKALPLLYVADLAEGLQLGGKPLDRRTIEGAITRVLSMQQPSGAFGLWSPMSEEDAWLTAYVMDFLTRAREKGHTVPATPYDKGMAWLASYAQEVTSRNLAPQAYAHYVLTRAQRSDPSRVRYFANTYQTQLPTTLARAQTAAALALAGDRAGAEQAFAALEVGLVRRNVSYDYGSPVRDLAAVTALMAESRAGSPDRLLTLADGLSAQIRERQYFSTQEDAWILMAADALMSGARPMHLEVDGRERPGNRPFVTTVAAADSAKTIALRNAGDAPVTRTMTVTGVPIEPEPAEANGFRLRRLVFDRAGNLANPATVKQSELLVVLLEGRFIESGLARSIIVDMLPAGLEIENVRMVGAADLSEFEWLGELTDVEHTEYRDDRFVAAIDLSGERNKTDFRVAYLVRAVTPGDFALPGAFVEDMYRPYLFARTSSGRITVRPE